MVEWELPLFELVRKIMITLIRNDNTIAIYIYPLEVCSPGELNHTNTHILTALCCPQMTRRLLMLTEKLQLF